MSVRENQITGGSRGSVPFGEQGFIFYKDVAVCIPPVFDGAAVLDERKQTAVKKGEAL